MPKLSIIVPVYKVEQYLRACVNSILSQDFHDFELILIDDGSPDNCPAICDMIAREDHRVRVIHQQNAGLASVRNVGLTVAVGDYIAFVDSDDLLSDGALSMGIQEIERTSAEVVLGLMTRFDNCGQKRPYTRLDHYLEMTGKDALKLILEGRLLNISVCGGLFKHSLFQSIHFPDGYICEDWFVTPSLYLNANKVVFVPKSYYLYRDNVNSTMGEMYKKPNPQVIDVAEHAISIIRETGDSELYKDTLWSNLRRVWNHIGRLYNKGLYDADSEFVKRVRVMFRSYWPELKGTNKMSFQELIGVWAFCNCNALFRLLRSIKQ